jgi:outer membrane protein TolC
VRRGLVPLETDLYEAALDASWEIDIFGGTRCAVEEARRDVLVSLLDEVGSSYIELRGLQQELAVTEANIRAQEQTLALTHDRVQAGLATELDVTRAQAQVATTRAEVPNLTSAMKRAVHRLSVLVGVSPGELAGSWLEARSIPAGSPEVPVGVPSDLLRRRPDIRRAERRAVALAHDRYRSGLVDFLDVLEAERTLYAAQTELARGERAVGQDLVRLYKALGGGWDHEAARVQVTPSPWPISSKK